MAYKPYRVQKQKVNNGNMGKKLSGEDGGRVRLFGFRSGVSWKMMIAIFYYGLMLLIYVPSIVNEIIHYEFTAADVVLTISKYLFIGIFLFSPAIFLSDFKYVDSLPFFKKRNFGSCLCGLILVFMFCYFMWNVDIMVMSSQYKESVIKYEKYLIQEQEKNRAGTQSKKMETQSSKPPVSETAQPAETMQ